MKKITISIFSFFIFLLANAQESEDDFLNDLLETGPVYTTSIFKASRIITGHSTKQPDKDNLEFRISHRFGEINDGAKELWGLDQATIHFSLEYSPLERLTLGVGRSKILKFLLKNW